MSYREVLEQLRRADSPTLLLPEDPRERPRSVALLSGSFDPMTVGHVTLAEGAAAHADLVLLLYSAATLPKEGDPSPPLLTEEERLDALEEFCRTRPGIQPAFASHGLLVEQVAAARARFPGAAVYLVMGSDKVLQLLDHRWYQDRDAALTDLFEQGVGILYAIRAGDEDRFEEALLRRLPWDWRRSFERLDVPPGVEAISSRFVRDQLRRGEDVGELVPSEVAPVLRKAKARGFRPPDPAM